MMKYIKKILFCSLCFFALASNVNAKSLKDLKDELAKDEADKAALVAKQKEVQKKMDSISNEIGEIQDEIDRCEKEIQKSKEKIIELDAKIIDKKKEIDSLLSFLQISDGDNVYLEYVFGASDFTDFIYRSAVVEQLTAYNDQLINEMYALIEENKKLQIKLADDIEASENAMKKLEKKLASFSGDMDDLSDDEKDVDADIKARKKEIEYYEETYKKNGCSDTEDIYSCIGVPYATGLTRPLAKGSVTSNFGMRYHPTLHYYRMHNGIDLGVSMNSNVYASAAGVVNKITVKSSCGGNMVWIQHNIDGKKYRTVYQHLHQILVSVGDVVTQNTVIGKSGGGESYDRCSTGPHLHFGVLTGWTGSSYVNPRNYIEFPAKGGRFYSRYY